MKINAGHLLSILLIISFCGHFWQQHQILVRDHVIANQKLLLDLPRQDTIRFQCRHCGWSHNLSTNDTNQTPLIDEK